MTRRLIYKALLLIAVCSPYLQSYAEDSDQAELLNSAFEPFWYFGVGGGSSNLEPAGDSAGFVPAENKSSGAIIFFGQKFKSKWAWEFSYTDAGSIDLTNPNPVLAALIPDASLDYSAASLFLNYYLKDDQSRFNAYVKAGVSSISTVASDDRIEVSSDAATPFSLGVGAELRMGRRWFLRLEHDNYAKDATLSNLSVGLRFGGPTATYVERPEYHKPLPVVIEYPLYVPDEQVKVLSEDRVTVTDVAGELRDISDELLRASSKPSADSPKNKEESARLAKHAGTLVETSKRLAIVEESILRTTDVDITTIDPETFVSETGEKLLLTPAEQSIELGTARRNIATVEKDVGKYPYARRRLSRVRGRIAVVEESLLFIPPWEEEEANRLCSDFGEKGERIHFRSNSANLTEQSKVVLDEMVEKMNRNARVIMEIHAHTDSWGTFAHNQRLSEERARNTVDYMVQKGVARERLLGRGYGELIPLDENKSFKGRASNRRVEFVIKNPNICKQDS